MSDTNGSKRREGYDIERLDTMQQTVTSIQTAVATFATKEDIAKIHTTIEKTKWNLLFWVIMAISVIGNIALGILKLLEP